MNSTAGDGFTNNSRVASTGPKEGKAHEPNGYHGQNYSGSNQNKISRIPAGMNAGAPKDVILN